MFDFLHLEQQLYFVDTHTKPVNNNNNNYNNNNNTVYTRIVAGVLLMFGPSKGGGLFEDIQYILIRGDRRYNSIYFLPMLHSR